jgi:hypothetical protein
MLSEFVNHEFWAILFSEDMAVDCGRFKMVHARLEGRPSGVRAPRVSAQAGAT